MCLSQEYHKECRQKIELELDVKTKPRIRCKMMI